MIYGKGNYAPKLSSKYQKLEPKTDSMPEMKPSIIISSGEPAGIGPDIIAKINPQDYEARLIVAADPELIESRIRKQGRSVRCVEYGSATGQANQFEIIPFELATKSIPGQLNPDNAQYVLDILTRCCNGCLDGEFAAMVTGPVQKDIINTAGVKFSGHTEFLAELCGVNKPVMLLAADDLRVALVTTHLPLRAVADAISQDVIIETVQIINRDLKSRFGLEQPLIKVCGLNPHAGENGYLGMEEIDIIEPALEVLRSQSIRVQGPYPADTLFTPAGLADADAVLAMYHDQGLPVLKHVGFHNAINTTLGLPIIRTSVDHGTALDLAGSDKADAGSLDAAIRSALQQIQHRHSHHHIIN